jgi:hypothetical protein
MPRTMFGKKIDEGKWAEAKAQAEKEGKGDNYAYITSIYKKMAHMSKASELLAALKKKGKSKNRPDSDFDPEQLKMGTAVEMEHGLGEEAAKEIAKDHLVEMSDYYTRLRKMEAKKSVDVFSATELLKGGRKGSTGEIRTWAGKQYIKTEKGWRPKPKKTILKLGGSMRVIDFHAGEEVEDRDQAAELAASKPALVLKVGETVSTKELNAQSVGGTKAPIKQVASELARQLWSLHIPLDIDVKYSAHDNSIYALYDTPRQYRHPDEYYKDDAYDSLEADPKYQEFLAHEEQILEVLAAYLNKHPEVHFETAGNVSGGDYTSV